MMPPLDLADATSVAASYQSWSVFGFCNRHWCKASGLRPWVKKGIAPASCMMLAFLISSLKSCRYFAVEILFLCLISLYSLVIAVLGLLNSPQLSWKDFLKPFQSFHWISSLASSLRSASLFLFHCSTLSLIKRSTNAIFLLSVLYCVLRVK